MISWLLVTHIAVLGYWLGSEFVINSTYRFVCFNDDMPFAERDRLMNHVMDVDQHVRYASALQLILGTMLAASYGFIPGGNTVVLVAGALGVVWLAFIEAVHRFRSKPVGQSLAWADRASRYVLMILLIGVAIGGIRFALIEHFKVWRKMAQGEISQANNETIKRLYVKATAVLLLLWFFIAAVVFLSVAKPF